MTTRSIGSRSGATARLTARIASGHGSAGSPDGSGPGSGTHTSARAAWLGGPDAATPVGPGVGDGWQAAISPATASARPTDRSPAAITGPAALADRSW